MNIEVENALRGLQHYAFPKLVREVFQHDNPTLTQVQGDVAFDALRDFFMLLWLSEFTGGKRSLGMPSVLADKAWHAFVLCTAEYQAFCDRFFGRMVHHRPDPKAQPTTLRADSAFSSETINTWWTFRLGQRDYRNFFRESRSGYPSLFETDRDAGLAIGWIWTEGALSAIDRRVGRTVPRGEMDEPDTPTSSDSTSDSNPPSHHHSGDHSGSSGDTSGSCSGGASCGSSCGGGSNGGN